MDSKRARLLFVVLSTAMVAATASLVRAAERIYFPGNGVSLPVVMKEVPASYPAAALKSGLEGTVLLESVVQPNGSVGSVKVVKSLDAKDGFDAAAVKAMRKWQFEPGLKDGKPVPVRITTEITFTAPGAR